MTIDIMQSLDYIEQNLKTDVTADEMASIAGYSVFHYYRLFSQQVGLPIAAYITKRRLDHALEEISNGRIAVEVVMEYGFDTYAGFYKAFIRIYGCSPKKYRTFQSIPFPMMIISFAKMYSCLLKLFQVSLCRNMICGAMTEQTTDINLGEVLPYFTEL